MATSVCLIYRLANYNSIAAKILEDPLCKKAIFGSGEKRGGILEVFSAAVYPARCNVFRSIFNRAPCAVSRAPFPFQSCESCLILLFESPSAKAAFSGPARLEVV